MTGGQGRGSRASLLMINISLCGYVTFLTHLSIGGHLDCLHLLTIMNNATMNIHIRVFVKLYVFISLGCIPRNGIAGSYSDSILTF